MRRLKAVLSPAPIAGRRSRLAVLGLGVALSTLAGVGSVAVANQREPEVALRPIAVVATLPEPKADTRPMPALAPLAAVVPLPKAEPPPRPAPTMAPEVITIPSWTRMPMPLTYPAAAIEQNSFSGRAELSCTVEADGRVSNCEILAEDPVGAGYGPAALEAAAAARLSPRSVDGASVGGAGPFTVRVTRQAA